MLKYQVTFIRRLAFDCYIEHTDIESPAKLKLTNQEDHDFIMQALKNYYPHHNIRIQRIKQLGTKNETV